MFLLTTLIDTKFTLLIPNPFVTLHRLELTHMGKYWTCISTIMFEFAQSVDSSSGINKHITGIDMTTKTSVCKHNCTMKMNNQLVIS